VTGADEHLSAPGSLLEPFGKDDRGAGHESFSGPACDHLAGVNADPDHEPFVDRRYGLADLDRCADRPQRVVLVRPRHAEHGHHRVSDELLHDTAVALGRRPRRREVPLQQGTGGLRIETLDQPGRVDQIGEQDGHRPP